MFSWRIYVGTTFQKYLCNGLIPFFSAYMEWGFIVLVYVVNISVGLKYCKDSRRLSFFYGDMKIFFKSFRDGFLGYCLNSAIYFFIIYLLILVQSEEDLFLIEIECNFYTNFNWVWGCYNDWHESCCYIKFTYRLTKNKILWLLGLYILIKITW